MEAEIERARRHVHEGEARIGRQQLLLAALRADGHPTRDAEDLLRVLAETLVNERDHLATLLYEQKRGLFTPR
jgi:hypothetical protein